MAITKQILPGVYSQITAGEREAALSARGTVAMALDLDWGGEFTTFLHGNDTVAPFGYDFTDPKIKLIREVMQNAGALLLYRLNAKSGQPAQGTLAPGVTAKAIHSGSRGNDIKVTVTQSGELFVIRTYLGTREMDAQAVSAPEDFRANSYIAIEGAGELQAVTVALSGGSNGDATGPEGYDAALDELQKHDFNILCYTGTNTEVKGKYAAFAEKLETMGQYIQVVMNEPGQKDVKFINNTVGGPPFAKAKGCKFGKAKLDKLLPLKKLSQVCPWQTCGPTLWGLQQAKTAQGEILFIEKNHRVCVLYDINSLTEFDADHPEDWRKNLVTRTLFTIAADLEKLLSEKVVGKIRNSRDARPSLLRRAASLALPNLVNSCL